MAKNDRFGIMYGALHKTVYVGRLNGAQTEFLAKEDMTYPATWSVGEYLLDCHDGSMKIVHPDGKTMQITAVLIDETEDDENAMLDLPAQGERECRRCGCTDNSACDTLLGPCSWRTTFDDNTGICSACPPESEELAKETPASR